MTATTYLEWEDQTNGSNNNTWGDVSDANSTIFEQAIARLGAVATTGGSTTLSSAQNRYPIITVTGALVSNATIVVRTAEKNWVFLNNTTGAFSLTVKTLAGTGKAIPRGRATQLYCDGVNVTNARESIVPTALASGAVDAITATFEPAFAASELLDGTIFAVEALGANLTATPTFSPDGNTAQIITKYGNQALVPSDIPRAGFKMLLCYRASVTKYELLNAPAALTNVAFTNVANTFTAAHRPSPNPSSRPRARTLPQPPQPTSGRQPMATMCISREPQPPPALAPHHRQERNARLFSTAH